jgi:SAM-dependent methyltransferase
MAIANAEMAAAWDGPEGQHWAEHAERYESMGPVFWDALVAAVGIAPDDDVLDVGCGTGRSSRDAARLAPAGSVLGVDLSGPMLERARTAAEQEGLEHVRFVQADAQVFPFPVAAFDLAISSFGAMFFADPVAAFSNIARSLRPGGRLGVLAWRRLEENEWLCSLRTALAAGRELPSPPVGMPGPFGLADPVQVDELLRSAGLEDVAAEAVDAPMRFGADVDDTFAFVSTLGITRGLLQGLEPEAATAALAALRHELTRHETADGVLLQGAAWVITARAQAPRATSGRG